MSGSGGTMVWNGTQWVVVPSGQDGAVSGSLVINSATTSDAVLINNTTGGTALHVVDSTSNIAVRIQNSGGGHAISVTNTAPGNDGLQVIVASATDNAIEVVQGRVTLAHDLVLIGIVAAASDAAAATAGVPLNGLYQNGGAVHVRLV